MSQLKMKELSEQLLQNTRAGTLRWSRAGGQALDLHIPQNPLTIRVSQRAPDVFVLALQDSWGRDVQTLTAGQGDTHHAVLMELHQLARESSQDDVDQIIDQALTHLRQKRPGDQEHGT